MMLKLSYSVVRYIVRVMILSSIILTQDQKTVNIGEHEVDDSKM